MPSADFLPIFFALAAGLVIVLYVSLDGFDLGLGILFPFAPLTGARDLMLASIAPVWDGNETWLILGAMILFAGFPGAFSILLPAFYAPLAIMLLGLVLRGVAFEFRAQRGGGRTLWTIAFACGSSLAAFCQGAVLGAFLSRPIAIANGAFAGGALDWLSPFTVLTGIGVVAGYALLGATWLIWRTEGPVQTFGREIAAPTIIAVAAAIAAVSIWGPFSSPHIREQWFSGQRLLYFSPLPVVTVGVLFTLHRLLWSRRDWAPFALANLLLGVSVLGLGVSVWPDATPGRMTIWQASSAYRTQRLLEPVIVAILPVIVGYVGFSYWAFRGKVAPPEMEEEDGAFVGGVQATSAVERHD